MTCRAYRSLLLRRVSALACMSRARLSSGDDAWDHQPVTRPRILQIDRYVDTMAGSNDEFLVPSTDEAMELAASLNGMKYDQLAITLICDEHEVFVGLEGDAEDKMTLIVNDGMYVHRLVEPAAPDEEDEFKSGGQTVAIPMRELSDAKEVLRVLRLLLTTGELADDATWERTPARVRRDE